MLAHRLLSLPLLTLLGDLCDEWAIQSWLSSVIRILNVPSARFGRSSWRAGPAAGATNLSAGQRWSTSNGKKIGIQG